MSEEAKPGRRHLVQTTAGRMRDLILAQQAETQIGSLPELAQALGVGIVTVQQAARILEHEGLLAVKRGPGGGYYGTRPDAASLERSMAAYLRVHGSHRHEALETMLLLDCELMPAAALCTDPALRTALQAHRDRIDACETPDERIAFENRLHDILFAMVDRPLIELLGRVTMRHYHGAPLPVLFAGEAGLLAWRRWRHRILNAILAGDEELARFEATRHRAHMLARLRERDGGAVSS